MRNEKLHHHAETWHRNSHYSMQIVGGLVFVTNPAADVSDREAALSYGAQFVGAGGLVHLHKLLTSCDVEAFR